MAAKSNKSTGRRYDLEYERYQGRPEQIRRRALRNKARRLAVKKYGKSKLKGKDVHHTDSKRLSPRNLRVISKSRNRGFRRSATGKNLGLRKKK